MNTKTGRVDFSGTKGPGGPDCPGTSSPLEVKACKEMVFIEIVSGEGAVAANASEWFYLEICIGPR